MKVRTYDPVKRRAQYIRKKAKGTDQLNLWGRTSGLNAILKATGTTRKEYDSALIRQDGKCAICDEAPQYGRRLSVDHDHTVGGFRGLLCTHCNLALGHFFDNLDYLVEAMNYVRTYREVKAHYASS